MRSNLPRDDSVAGSIPGEGTLVSVAGTAELLPYTFRTIVIPFKYGGYDIYMIKELAKAKRGKGGHAMP
jgi:hypothetical protein